MDLFESFTHPMRVRAFTQARLQSGAVREPRGLTFAPPTPESRCQVSRELTSRILPRSVTHARHHAPSQFNPLSLSPTARCRRRPGSPSRCFPGTSRVRTWRWWRRRRSCRSGAERERGCLSGRHHAHRAPLANLVLNCAAVVVLFPHRRFKNWGPGVYSTVTMEFQEPEHGAR